jgi:hypothetical protein
VGHSGTAGSRSLRRSLLTRRGRHGLPTVSVDTPSSRNSRPGAALGAQIADVQRVFLRQGLWLIATGILMGIGVAMVVTRVMSTFLFGVGPMDPATYAAVSATLVAVALMGTYLPARRATRVDPLMALRGE